MLYLMISVTWYWHEAFPQHNLSVKLCKFTKVNNLTFTWNTGMTLFKEWRQFWRAWLDIFHQNFSYMELAGSFSRANPINKALQLGKEFWVIIVCTRNASSRRFYIWRQLHWTWSDITSNKFSNMEEASWLSWTFSVCKTLQIHTV